MIEGFVGLIGAGKTMLSVRHAVDLARTRGALLVSNILVECPGVDFVHLGVGDDGVDLEQLRLILEAARGLPGEIVEPAEGCEGPPVILSAVEPRGVVLLVDEIGIIMPARFWQSFPVDLMFTLSQSRKLGVDLVWTSQDVEQVDAYLRRLTQWVYKVRCVPHSTLVRREAGKRPWFFWVTKWRPGLVDKKDKRIGRDLVRYRRRWELWYDTDELVRPPERLRRGRVSRASGGRDAAASAPLT
jgi:hypothetical protein